MKEIKFTTKYEPTLSFNDKDFKRKYEERIGNNSSYCQIIDGEKKHLAVCPRCNNPVVILGIYKKINGTPHARHKKDITMPGITEYNKYTYFRCPYHRKRADYIKEYVPEGEQDSRLDLYQIAKNHFDKAIYLLQKTTGIYITNTMADQLAENYVALRAYNYIDATFYNIPWYLIYCYNGFPMYHMNVIKKSTLYKHIDALGFNLIESKIQGYVYIEEKNGYVLRATNYRYAVDNDENLNEWLDFAILEPDNNEKDILLFKTVDRFSISVDSYYFENLIGYSKWQIRHTLLDIASKYMKP